MKKHRHNLFKLSKEDLAKQKIFKIKRRITRQTNRVETLEKEKAKIASRLKNIIA